MSRSLYTMIKFPNPWAKFPWGGPPPTPSLSKLTFPLPLSCFLLLHFFHFPYLKALIPDLWPAVRFQFLQLRPSIAVYIPFFLLCSDYLLRLILHWPRWKLFTWRQTQPAFSEHCRYESAQEHIVSCCLTFCNKLCIQCVVAECSWIQTCALFVGLGIGSPFWEWYRKSAFSMEEP